MKKPADGWDADERAALDVIEPALDELQARHAGDPPIELLRAAHAEVLPDDFQRDARQWLEASDWNRALVTNVEAIDAPLTAGEQAGLLRRIRKGQADEQIVGRRLWVWQPAFAIAAVLVIVMAGTWLIWQAQTVPEVSKPPANQVAVASPTVASPVYVLSLDKPEIRISASSLTFRGDRGDNGLLADLKPGFDALRAGDYQAAETALSPLAGKYPSAVEVPFYLGVSQLFLNRPKDALTNLTRAEALADSSFGPDVSWYAAVASERAGQPDAARARLAVLCKQPNVRAAEACAVEQKLK
jgi:hypothetical protein